MNSDQQVQDSINRISRMVERAFIEQMVSPWESGIYSLKVAKGLLKEKQEKTLLKDTVDLPTSARMKIDEQFESALELIDKMLNDLASDYIRANGGAK